MVWTGTQRKRLHSRKKFSSEKAREQAAREKPLCSLGTRRLWWRVFKVLLKDAHADGITIADLTYRIDGPRKLPGDTRRREQRTLTQHELGVLLKWLHKLYPQRYAEVVMLGATGARSGEVWALHWPDLQLDAQKGGEGGCTQQCAERAGAW